MTRLVTLVKWFSHQRVKVGVIHDYLYHDNDGIRALGLSISPYKNDSNIIFCNGTKAFVLFFERL